MKKTKTVPFLVESQNGHDEKQINLGDLQNEVEAELKKDKWVTIEKADGSSELLTKKDIPLDDHITEGHDGVSDDDEVEESEEDEDEEDAKDAELMSALKKDSGSKSPKGKPKTVTKPSTPTTPKEEWSSKFSDITSATSTAPAKGG